MKKIFSKWGERVKAKLVGETKDRGFQVGVRRTFPISQEEAWRLVASREGLAFWLGEGGIDLKPGQGYETTLGNGEIRIVKPNAQLRLTWKKLGWQRPSTVQVRFLSVDTNKTTISFHQELLPDQKERELMKSYWENVLLGIKEKIHSSFIENPAGKNVTITQQY
ncbi:SRPBCC domain-containing protein [Neobacillus piezotolerans]|uniref:SRPBCC domain-containing protein n=1 Tax=Neobacillus piezotolerans TaxID=2259171 RepID=A0A3D8GRS1_9BACI|nr:SRPBCC domain-containing protein [Neobacillus piezotolerans]RDU36992.1 SRPBCC domain-containing protein [Neobacillus piezotolerans]